MPGAIDHVAMDSLFQMFQRHNPNHLDLVRKTNYIQVGKESLVVESEIEFNDINRGETVYGVKYTARLTGTTSATLEFGTIGIGKNKAEALHASVVEWQQHWGWTFTQFLLDQENAVSLPVGTLFESKLAARGELPVGKGIFDDANMTQRIVKAITPYLPEDEIVGINLFLAPQEDKTMGGYCVINNVENSQAFRAVSKLNWPIGKEPYTAKLYYILDQRKD